MSKQKYRVTLADTAMGTEPTGVATRSEVIEVSEDETVENAAVDIATERGQEHGTHYLVVNIQRGDN